MNTDLHYAIKQLKPIVVGNTFNHLVIMDRVRRALDALERMAEAEGETESEMVVQVIGIYDTGDDCNSPHAGKGKLYHCHSLTCPRHGERNRSIT